MLAQLYELYEQKMYAAAYAILHSVEQAEDAVQDSFVKAVSYLGEMNRPDSTKTARLMMRILKTTAIDQYRKNNTENERLQNDTVSQSMMKVSPLRVEEQTLIRELLQDLPQRYLEVVKLRSYYGFSSKETAAILSISTASVDKRMERAKKQILSRLNEEEQNYGRKEIRTNITGSW